MQDFFHQLYRVLYIPGGAGFLPSTVLLARLVANPKGMGFDATKSQHSHVNIHSLVAFAMPSASKKSRPKSLPLMTYSVRIPYMHMYASNTNTVRICKGSVEFSYTHDSNGILLSQYHNFMWPATHLGLVHSVPQIHPTLCQYPFPPPKKIQHRHPPPPISRVSRSTLPVRKSWICRNSEASILASCEMMGST